MTVVTAGQLALLMLLLHMLEGLQEQVTVRFQTVTLLEILQQMEMRILQDLQVCCRANPIVLFKIAMPLETLISVVLKALILVDLLVR